MVAELPLTARYALNASVCLARQQPEERRSAKELATETGIPAAFLSKILAQLARAGLVDGERGHHGGYRLARPSSRITMIDVIRAVDPDWTDGAVCAMGDRTCGGSNPCALHELWALATAPMNHLANTVTLERLAQSPVAC